MRPNFPPPSPLSAGGGTTYTVFTLAIFKNHQTHIYNKCTYNIVQVLLLLNKTHTDTLLTI